MSNFARSAHIRRSAASWARIHVRHFNATNWRRELETLETWGISLTEQGALCYRSGRFADAVPLLERGIAADKKPGAAVLDWLWLAMAHNKLGHADESKRWLKEATTWLDSLGPTIPPNSESSSYHLHNFLEAYVLRNEAAAITTD